MAKCTNCHREISNNANYCPYCRAKVEPAVMQAPPPAAPMIHSNIPLLADGEEAVRSYQCATSLTGTCFLTVTNKRIIFRAVSNDKSFVEKEVHIDTVTGVDCMRGKNFNFKLMIPGVLLGIFALTQISDRFGFGLVLLIAAAALIYFAIRPTYSLKILASKCESSPIDIGMGATSLLGNKAVIQFNCMPTDQAYKMINELGALVLDLQTMGDLAVTNWKKIR